MPAEVVQENNKNGRLKTVTSPTTKGRNKERSINKNTTMSAAFVLFMWSILTDMLIKNPMVILHTGFSNL